MSNGERLPMSLPGMLRAEPGESIVVIQVAAPDRSCETALSERGLLVEGEYAMDEDYR